MGLPAAVTPVNIQAFSLLFSVGKSSDIAFHRFHGAAFLIVVGKVAFKGARHKPPSHAAFFVKHGNVFFPVSGFAFPLQFQFPFPQLLKLLLPCFFAIAAKGNDLLLLKQCIPLAG